MAVAVLVREVVGALEQVMEFVAGTLHIGDSAVELIEAGMRDVAYVAARPLTALP